ncbi:MAG: metallopeptidase TldD-related protein [Candidatus Delongbacteria bacterium]|jgi:predicted Zn-dependent protease|nr:metallopeptidase TldD-related protein [Candidatus Delongbacteria bacterium]
MINTTIKDIILKVRDIAVERNIVATFSLHYENSHLMRIGNNSVSLSTSEELTRLDIKVTNGLKQGSHTEMGEISSVEQVEKSLNIAHEKALVAKEKDYQPIEDEVEETLEENSQYDENFKKLTPAFKAESYGKIFNGVGNDYNFSGSWSSGITEQFIVTTKNKNYAYNIGTDQIFTIVLKHPKKSWEITSTQTGWKKDDFSVDTVIKELKSYLNYYENMTPSKIEPKDYTVVLGPAAIAEVIQMAIFTGFKGRTYEEKQAWTSKNSLGDKVLGENITIVDDPSNDKTFKKGFDLSGQKRTKRNIVENGIFSSLMYDSTTAAKFKKEKTGHNTNSFSIVVNTGEGEECPLEAVKDMDEVLYIPALHYINLPNVSKGIFTGSSRFNALLVRKGKVVGPIFSSRITDTFQNVFGNVDKISKLAESVNLSNTYGRRSPVAFSVPNYMVCKGVKITDCAESF